jgi:L-iditol 2-dehydrogenase
MILGHETSAEVHEVGEGVTHLKPGDIVAIEPGVPCTSCPDCKEGRYNLCKDMSFHATPPYDGTLTRFFKHPAGYCFK